MKKALLSFAVLIFCLSSKAQTRFIQTYERFKNGEYVWNVVVNNNQTVGQFWPVKAINLVSKETDSLNFEMDLASMTENLGAVSTAPDGMTKGNLGSYQMEGACLSHGRPCGDGFIYQYGIVLVSPGGYQIKFTHRNEVNDFDSLYDAMKRNKGTLFFLPSIFRNGLYQDSEKMIDKVLIRREVPDGEQIGVVLFDQLTSINKAREIILGLDRPGKSKTTHIYVLDGGPSWGQACKNVNGTPQIVGTRDDRVVTNYLVFY